MRYTTEAEVWLHPGAGGWHFVTLDPETSRRLKALRGPSRAWGSMPVHVTVNDYRWATSLFPDAKKGVFLLPLKAEARRRAGIATGDWIEVNVEAA